jgi:gliding motility-associated-like protein
MSKIVWDFGDGTGDTSFYPRHVYSDTGTYNVTATYHYYTCDSVRVQSSTVHINNVIKDFIHTRDTTLCLLNPVRINIIAKNDSLRWNDGSIDSVRLLSDAGSYYVVAYQQCGSSIDTIDINTIDCDTNTTNTCVAIPTAYTPNNDGLNDTWKPIIQNTCESQIQSYNLLVFNRWGAVVFNTNSKTESWLGTNNEIGTYVYYIEYKIDNTIYKKQGTVSLIR